MKFFFMHFNFRRSTYVVSCYLLLLFVLIFTAATTFGAPGDHPSGHDGKHKDKGIKCHGLGCSLAVRGWTNAILTLNSFEKGRDGGGPSECDGKYHSDNTLIVALSTGWYHGGSLCHKYITIYAKNGRSTKAMAVNECDVSQGCWRNIVDGSMAVWKALGVPRNSWGLDASHMVPLK